MRKKFNILIGINHSVSFDRRAFTGIAQLANERGDVRLVERLSNLSWSDAVKASDIHGLIVSRKYGQSSEELDRLGLPFISLADQHHLGANQHVVATEERAIGLIAAKHYLETGYRDFGVCTRPGLVLGFGERVGGFVEEVQAGGWRCDVGPTYPNPGNPEEFEDETTWFADTVKWLTGLPKPVGIFAPYDYHARVVVNAAEVAGLRVPDDVAVIGVDDDEVYCMTTSPQLSSVVTPGRQIGQLALATLLKILDHDGHVPRRTLVPPPIIVLRGSSSHFATQDPDVIAAVRYIRDHAPQGITVEDVANHVALSRRTLERRFGQTLSHSVRDELRIAKVDRAKRLLIDTNLPLLEVARRSGLIWQQQLSRAIKLATGQSPARFRATAQRYRTQ